jgi:hypothetical protein
VTGLNGAQCCLNDFSEFEEGTKPTDFGSLQVEFREPKFYDNFMQRQLFHRAR